MDFHVSATSGVLGRDRFNDWRDSLGARGKEETREGESSRWAGNMAVAKFVARQTDWYELREAFPFLLIRNGKWLRPEWRGGILM